MPLSHDRQNSNSASAQNTLVQIAEVNFICPHCGSFYEVVKAEALPNSVDLQIMCATCAGPLPAREAQFALQYFLLRKTNRGWLRTPVAAELSRAPAPKRFDVVAHVEYPRISMEESVNSVAGASAAS